MVRSFNQAFDLYRPNARTTYDAEQTYTKVELERVKMAQPSKGWTVSTSGAVQSVTATLYFNLNVSGASPALDPLFKAGDIIVETGGSLSGDRKVVQTVTEQWLKGTLHHYEVVLV